MNLNSTRKNQVESYAEVLGEEQLHVNVARAFSSLDSTRITQRSRRRQALYRRCTRSTYIPSSPSQVASCGAAPEAHTKP